MFKRTTNKIKTQSKQSKLTLAVVALLFAGIGGYFVVNSFAVTPTTAYIWVSQSGSGSCSRSSSGAVDFATASTKGNVCTWSRAYDVALDGDTVLIKGGATSYGDIRMPANKSDSPKVTFTPAQGESVIVGNFVNGWINNFSGADNLILNGPVKAHSFRTDGTVGVTVDTWDVDVNGDTYTQPFHVEGVRGSATVNGFTLKNSKVHHSFNANALMYLSGDGFTIDNNQIYEALNNTNGVIHDECIYASDMQHVTFSRNHIWSCQVQDIMLTNTELATDWLIENNVFEYALGSSANTNSALVFRGGSPSPSPDGMIIRYNTFGAQAGVTINNTDNAPTTNGLQVYGNFFALNAPCGLNNTQYANNVTPTGQGNCGGTGAQSFSSSSIQAGFTNWKTWGGSGGATAESPGDYSIKATSPLRDIVNLSVLFAPPPNNTRVSTSFPALDILGNTRYAGSAPDIGAYEYGATSGGGGTCTSTKTADINCDNIVSITDLSLLLYNYSKTTSQLSNPRADIVTTGTSAGKVDITDLSALLSQYGT